MEFNYGTGTFSHGGCGVTLRGQFWYLGGFDSQSKRQVNLKSNICNNRFLLFQASKVVACQMIRQLELSFDFDRGSCNTFNVPDEKVLMCFSSASRKRCDM